MGDHHEKVHEQHLNHFHPAEHCCFFFFLKEVTKENWTKPSRAQEPATSLQPQYEQRIKADTRKIMEMSEKRVNIMVKLRIY